MPRQRALSIWARRLRVQAASQDLEMSELGAMILDHALGLMESGKVPPGLEQAIKAFKKKRDEGEASER